MEIAEAIDKRVQQDMSKNATGVGAAATYRQSESKPDDQPNGDRLTLSPEARKKLIEQRDQTANIVQQMKEQMEASNARAKKQAEVIDKAGKCMTIAGRIMAGDIVPQSDERFLAKNDSKLYMMAISMRRQRDNPRRYRSIAEKATDSSPVVRSASDETAQQDIETPPVTECGGENASAPTTG